MSTDWQSLVTKLEDTIEYRFSDQKLIETALTHTSFVKGEHRQSRGGHNERLEFLGDAVLELVVSDHLFHTKQEQNEGAMTRMRARLVSEEALYLAARSLGIHEAIRLSHGEELTRGREKPSIVSDAMEAVIGAVYLDGGMENARRLIMEKLVPQLESVRISGDNKDAKTRLQEYIQQRHLGGIVYRLVSTTGPEHEKAFVMDVLVAGRVLGRGTGTSKQAAGQAAAQSALKKIQEGADGDGERCD